eukprot:TRINITY_DN11566_c0_g1_i3.p1 TRINITY_DN11566_c0_g1~~TRINITY_DN11566_c0_g1_i3.p1  ORF type:complete len:358 (+),score=58.89 TRINITY_DN11566_c0_g1_i3:127-1200(+)
MRSRGASGQSGAASHDLFGENRSNRGPGSERGEPPLEVFNGSQYGGSQHGGSQSNGYGGYGADVGPRYMGCEESMLNAGVSQPWVHGQGRRHIDAQDNLRFESDVSNHPREGLWGPDGPVNPGREYLQKPTPGRPSAPAMLRHEYSNNSKLPTSKEMKESVEEWLSEVFGVVVTNQQRWQEVAVESHGSHWVMTALSSQGKSLAREGSSAKAVSEKLSVMPLTELRHFGLGFAPPMQPAAAPPLDRKKGSVHDRSPTLVSPGVHDSMRQEADYQFQGQGISSARKAPEDMGRRYICSGKDHFDGFLKSNQDAPVSGRRYIGTRDHIEGGTHTDSAEASQVPTRGRGQCGGGGNGPFW